MEIKIGEFLIKILSDTHIWISCNEEAGSFEIEKLEQVIDDFFYKNF